MFTQLFHFCCQVLHLMNFYFWQKFIHVLEKVTKVTLEKSGRHIVYCYAELCYGIYITLLYEVDPCLPCLPCLCLDGRQTVRP